MSQDVFQSSDGGNVKYADNESMWGSSANLGTPVAASTAARPKQTYLDRPSNGAFGSFLDQTSNSDLLENQRLSGLLQDIDLSGVSFSSSESRPSNIASTNSKDNYLTDTSSLGLIPECEMEGLSIGLLPVDSDDNFSDRTITPVAWHNHCPRDSDGEGFIPDSLEEKMIPQDNLGVRGAATGIESDGSEINTDDELEAARKEIARQQRDQYLLQHRRGEIEEQRPGLEGGNSNEDASLISSENEPVSLRQSAEGDVSFSPVPGDGGGGGDGSSGAGTDDSDDDDNESGFNPVSNDAPSTMDVLRRLGLAGDGVDNLIPPMPDYKNSADFPGSSRMRPTGDDDPLNRQVRFVSPSGSTIPSHIRPFQGSTYSQASGRDSDSQYSDELQLASKFFLPTTHSYSNTMAEDVASTPWSFDDSSFHASEIGAITQDNNDDDVEDDHDVTLRCVPDIEFDKTLTSDEIRRGEGDEHVQSPQNPFVGRSSLGSFGLGTGDFTFSQNLAFGEDEFAQLDPAALSPRSNLSNEQMNLSQERAEERAEVQGAESGEEDYVSDPQQSRKSPTGYDSGRESTPHSPSYIEDNGEILTDLAFKSPLPAMNKHGGFKASGDDDDFGFGIDSDEDFLPADEAVAKLAADQEEFEKENIFMQDAMVPPSDDPPLGESWGLHDGAILSFNNITGNESFCRISIGTFLGARSEALGGLARAQSSIRPTFGAGDVITPPHTNGPIALIGAMGHTHDINLDGSFEERKSGVGEHDIEHDVGAESISNQTRVIPPEERMAPAGIRQELGDADTLMQSSMLKEKQDTSVNIVDIATAIANASDNANPEELAALIIKFSQKPIKSAVKQTEHVHTVTTAASKPTYASQTKIPTIEPSEPFMNQERPTRSVKSSPNQVPVHQSHVLPEPVTNKQLSHDRMFRPIKSDDSTEVVEALKPGRQSQLFKVPEVPQQRHAMPRGYNGFEGIPTYHMKLPEIPKEFSSSAPGTAKSGKKGKLSFSPPNKNMEQMLKQKSQSLPELADNTSHKTDYQRYEKHEFGLPPEKCPSRGGRTTPETVTKRQRHFLNLPNRVDTYSYPMPTNDNEHLVHSKPQPVRPFDEQSTHKEHGRKIGTHKSKKSSRERSPSSGFGESLDGLTMNSIMTSQSLTSSSKLPTPTSSSHLKLKSVDSSHEPKINYGAKSEHSAPSAIYRRSRDATQLASSNVPDEEKEKSAEKYRVSIYNMKKNREPSRSPERNVSYGSVIEQKAAIAKTLSTPVCDADEGGDVSYIGKLGVPEFNDCSVLDSSTPKKTLFSEKTQEDLTPLHFAQSGCKALKDDKNEAVTTETIPSIKFVEGVQPRNQLTTVPTLLTSQSLLSTTLASQYLNSRPLTTSQKHAVPSVSPSHSLNISPASSTVITSSPSYQPTPNTVSLSQNVGSTTGQSGIVHRPTFSSAKVSQHVATPNYPGQSGVVLSSVYSGLAPRVAATVAPPQATRPAAPSASLLDLSKGVVIPSDLRFGGVCCVGITVQTSLPIHNRTNRWINSTMKLISVTANDAQVDLENYTPFIMKSSAIICPGKSEDTNILFVPKHPGIFVAHLQISSSLVVAENTNIPQPTPSISVVTVHAVAEKANIQVEADNPQSLHFGEVAYGHTRSKALKIYNRGKSSVPIRLIISACSIAWHCYSFGKLDTRLETLSPGGTAMTPRGSSVLNIIVPGRTDNKASIDDPHLVLIDFKAPHRNMDHVAVLGVAEMITARVDVELDTPDNHNIASRALKVTVGTTRLHILKELLHKPLFLAAPPGKTATQFLPLKNAGNLMITVELKITQTQEFFSVIPATLTLKPDEMTDIVVKFTPVDAPVAIDSLLLMSVLPDGPEYEVKLQGEGTMSEHRSQRTSTGSLHSHKSSPQSMLLCNKQFVNWGGVPIGRALQQKVVLRNNLQNDVLKLRIFIRADHQDFQLQSSFGHQENLSDSRQVILKPLEDFPLHVLFAPTSIISRQAKLVMKPSTGGTKFTVPLYGYGGISNLIIEDLETMGSTFMSNMGSLSLGKHSITQITIQNTGPRAAFVKAIPFEDMAAKIKLSPGVLVVEPSEFIVKEKSTRTVTIMLNPSERETGLCHTKSNVVTTIGFFYGDEITRQQYRRTVHKSSTKPMALSENNPLKGVIFDCPYSGEDYVYEAYNLPECSNDVRLFYSCMSRLMLALTGNPPCEKSFYDLEADSTCMSESPGMMPKTEDDTINFDQTINKPGLLPTMHTPPVKGSSNTNGNLRLYQNTQVNGDDNSCTHWEVTPEQILLSTQPDIHQPVNRSRIQLINYTERKLSFELLWPGHCLTVTPQNGVLEARSQLLICVSANPSIHSRGIQLPWKGSILVKCDGGSKEIRVQIHGDLVMEKSVQPTIHEEPHRLPRMTTTQHVTVTHQKRLSSPQPIRLAAQRLEFPATRVQETTETCLDFENTTSEIMRWSLSSIAPAYVKQESKEVYRATYTAFRFTKQSGMLTPGQFVKIPVVFIPRDVGSYSQYWELEANSKESVASTVQQTKIELAGDGVKAAAALTKTHRRGPLAPTVPMVKPFHQSTTDNTEPVTKTQHTVPKSLLDAVTSSSSSHHAIILPKDKLVFPATEAGHVFKLKLQIKNEGTVAHTLKFVNPHPPFSISHSEYSIKPRHYLHLPVSFKPEQAGIYESLLVIATDVEHSLVAKLYGECL